MSMKRRDQLPRALSAEVVATLLDTLSKGSYIETAVAASGISRITFWRWLRAGRDAIRRKEEGEDVTEADMALGDLCIDVDAALASGESALASRLYQASEKDWKAALAVLERRWPERWGQKARPTEDLSSLSKDELIRRIREELDKQDALEPIDVRPTAQLPPKGDT